MDEYVWFYLLYILPALCNLSACHLSEYHDGMFYFVGGFSFLQSDSLYGEWCQTCPETEEHDKLTV